MSNQLLLRRRTMAVVKRPNYLKFTALEDGCTLSLNKVGNPTDHPTEYSLNKGAFVPYVFGTIITFNEGDTIEWRRAIGYESNIFSTSKNDYYTFATTGNIYQDGLVTTLLSSNENITSIIDWAFYKLIVAASGFTGSLTLQDGIVNIYSHVFHDCSGITGNINIPSSVTQIGGSTFANTRITGLIEIPNSISTIEGSLFASTTIEKVVIPASVTRIMDDAFFNCQQLSCVIFESNTPPQMKIHMVFSWLERSPILKIYVPYSEDHSVLETYKNMDTLNRFKSKMFELDENGNIPTTN